MYFFDLNRIDYKLKREGVHVKAVTGARVEMVFVILDPGFESDHSHVEEQMGLVLSGRIRLTIGGEARTCEKGEAYHIPPNVRHSFKVLSGSPAEVLDIFSPPKAENKL